MSAEALGLPIFGREISSLARRPRTYVFQTAFLTVLVLAILPLWPSGGAQSGADVAETGRMIFEWGGYLQLILLALLAPAITANAITQEKERGTLDLLLLTQAGPFAIVVGKFTSRLFNLLFLLFLTLPLLFALLTLGGFAGSTLLQEIVILLGFAILGSGLGTLLSTILAKPTAALGAGYALVAVALGVPEVLRTVGALGAAPGGFQPLLARVDPLHDLIYVFHPTWFLVTSSQPTGWWVCPLWNAGLGLALVALSGLLLPYARSFERVLSLRRALEAFDRATYTLLRPTLLIRHLRGQTEAASPVAERPPPIGKRNPILWKETSVNTIGRFRTWWRVNLAVLVLLCGTYVAFMPLLSTIEFHQVTIATLAGLVVLLSTVIAATTVSQEREDGSLVLVATTPVDCATYVKGKALGIGRNIIFLIALPFVHAAIFIAAGVIHPATFLLLCLAVPSAAAAAIVQGIFVSLAFPTTLRAILAAIGLVALEAVLPLVCCVPTFNLPFACYLMTLPTSGLTLTGGGSAGMWAALNFFSALTQVAYTVVVYSLIRSDFDRYLGRAT